MCMLCQIQRCSRGVATMLPWLVIPLIGLWAVSQLLPPAFRFEITSPRFACVMVLLFTLVWYEVLMPWLSAWRVRRNARLREKKRLMAIEMQKLKKIATRKCRNCLTPYRDQNPGGGRFMCSYCGHVSKRPVLDLPVQPRLGLLKSGILKDLVGKGGKILNDKVWSRRWMCGEDSLENGQLSYSSPWSTYESGFYDREHCLSERSYSRFFYLACKLLTDFITSTIWLCGCVFRICSSGDDDALTNTRQREMLDKVRENGESSQANRCEKARRKAEEKRQARLEKELLEEEERKQREEVARLVEERRKLREEQMETKKERANRSPSDKGRDSKREAENRLQEKRKERDRGSCKISSDTEELDRRAGKESERNKYDASDRRPQHKNRGETAKTHSVETFNGSNGAPVSSHSHGNVGTRNLDSMRGNFASPARAFTGNDLVGKNTSTVPREHKTNAGADHIQTHAPRRELSRPNRVTGKLNGNVDDRSINQPVLVEPQPAPKRSWQQLFTRSSAVSRSPSNVISRPCAKPQDEVQRPPHSGQPPSTRSIDNPISFGLPPPFPVSTSDFGPTTYGKTLPVSSEALFPLVGDVGKLLPEESEIFEDPCYIPDPVTLLGPVSESLDNFQLDHGVASNVGLDKLSSRKNVNVSSDVTRPSPIEAPLSRSCVPEERHAGSFHFSSTPESQDITSLPMKASLNNASDTGTWQMWNSSPLGQVGLSLIGTLSKWYQEPTRSNTEGAIPTAPPKTMASLFKNDNQAFSVSHSPQTVYAGSSQNVTSLGANLPNTTENEFQKSLFGTYSGSKSQFSLNPELASMSSHPFELSPPDSSTNNVWTQQGSGEGVDNSHITRPQSAAYAADQVYSLFGNRV